MGYRLSQFCHGFNFRIEATGKMARKTEKLRKFVKARHKIVYRPEKDEIEWKVCSTAKRLLCGMKCSLTFGI